MPPGVSRGMSASSPLNPTGPLLEVVNALADREGELEVRLENFTVHLPMAPEGIRMEGTLRISLRMRGLSDEEKRARSERSIRQMQA